MRGRGVPVLTPVFPLPVSAAISTSPPPNMRGTASACTSVGRLKKDGHAREREREPEENHENKKSG